jgi:nitrogen fixation/metabolism regulation signal transduction histidine kinase
VKNNRIKLYLFITILILSLLPLCVSYLFLEDVIEGALNIGLNEKMDRILASSQLDLKKLRNMDPESSDEYKKRFFEIENARIIYKDVEYSKEKLKDAYISYFLIGFFIVLCFSLIAAIFLSTRITKSYNLLMETLMKKNEKLRQLKNIDQFQEIAGKLAHEITTPLTPIEMKVTSLPSLFRNISAVDFKAHLKETQNMVKIEIRKLKEMVQHFKNFSRLPDSVLKKVNFVSFLDTFLDHYQATWPDAKITVDYQPQKNNEQFDFMVNMDEGLFRQVLINLLNNAVQANPGSLITITLTIQSLNNSLHIFLVNEGKSISPSERERLFDTYYTTKNSTGNMGLGLSIVQKIILQHQGEIICLPLETGAGFKITLPAGE